MVIEYMQKSKVNGDLLSFLADNKCGEIEFDLLRFMGQHPRAKLSFYVITQAFRIATIDLGNALMALVKKGILAHRLDGHGLVTYSLSPDEKTSAHIRELSSLDWSVAMALKKELKDRAFYYQDLWRDSKRITGL
jgi:hypothetical protein